MKTNYKILLCIALLIPSISYADWNWALWPWTANGPDLVTTGDVQSRSDRQRVGGSALILKSDGAIDEPSIPANAINKPSETGPDNKIFDGKVQAQPIDAPKVEKELIVDPKTQPQPTK